MACPQIPLLFVSLVFLVSLAWFSPNLPVEVHHSISLGGLANSLRYPTDGRIPKTIYMFWDIGWSKAPALQNACKNSWMLHNADYEINLLNLSEAERLINRRAHIPERAWQSASIQAKSDIVRVLLLAKYGGVWADATLYCLEPLSNWLDSREPFLAYQRHDVRHTDIYSWVTSPNNPTHRWTSSWFLAAQNSSTIIQQWRHDVIKFWKVKENHPNKEVPYHWVHRLFFDLRHRSISFKQAVKAMPKLGASGPHCLTNGNPHMYKLSATSCKQTRLKIFQFLAAQNGSGAIDSTLTPTQYGHEH